MDEIVNQLQPYKDFFLLIGVFIGACLSIYKWILLPVHKVVRAIFTIVDRELTPNGGYSMKDMIVKATDEIVKINERHSLLSLKVNRIDSEMQSIRNNTKVVREKIEGKDDGSLT